MNRAGLILSPPGRWLTVTAIFELVLAGVFLVIGFVNPIPRSGFYLTAAILVLVDVGLLIWGRKWSKDTPRPSGSRPNATPQEQRYRLLRSSTTSRNHPMAWESPASSWASSERFSVSYHSWPSSL
jgi:hypothetical protein